MLNREKYAKEILNIVCDGKDVAVVDGKPKTCNETQCKMCDLNGGCYSKFKEWANSEYVEPQVDWSKVPVDTPILVKSTDGCVWMRRYFAKYENGSVYAWEQGTTSWSVEDPEYVCEWKYAKLAESEG